MKKKKRLSYSNPTIIEAVVEVRFSSSIDSQKIKNGLGSKYKCAIEDLVVYTAAFSPEGMSLHHNKQGQTRLKFTIKNQVSAQVYADRLSFHWVGKYPGWDVFQPEFENFWKQFSMVYPEVKRSRVGVRFINMLNQKTVKQKVGYWLKPSLNYPESILSAKSDYFLSFRRPLEKERFAQIFVAEGEPKAGNVRPLILDIDIIQNINESLQLHFDPTLAMESLHEEIIRIFEGSISLNYKKVLSKKK
jgi:uncharacterized protein (TIGR04255 family)